MSRLKRATVQALQKRLLAWFDRHRRVMPWRAAKGKRPDPYRVWLSEIMLQQTTVAAVGPYFLKFIEKWPTVEDMAEARIDDVLAAWAGLGYYARARNLHKCAGIVARDMGGVFPDNEEALLSLPGIGPYTAAAIASIAFDRPAVAVDGNVERVVARFFAIVQPLPAAKAAIRERAAQLAGGVARAGDFTQAFMELGATVCTPTNPKCGVCPWREGCKAQKKGIAAGLPVRARRVEKPLRHGKVFWIRRKDGKFLIEKRKDTGLYEGMYQLPTTAWELRENGARPEMKQQQGKSKEADGMRPTGVSVRHSFTHFNLILEIWHGTRVLHSIETPDSIWISKEDVDSYALPSLMKKAIRLCLEQK